MADNDRWTILLDLDETLISSTYLYHAAGLRCGALITETLGTSSIHPTELFQAQFEIDQALVRSHGFALDRFPKSWARVYEKLARKAGLAVDKKVSAKLMRIAAGFQRGPFVPIEGAKEALMELQREHHGLHLITAGDKGLQEKKVKLSGFSSLLDSVNVTGQDKKPTMAKIAGERRDRVMMVGDSLRGDIKPAMELGIVAVHVPSHTWPYANVELDRRRYRTVASVAELPALVRSLEGRRAPARARRA